MTGGRWGRATRSTAFRLGLLIGAVFLVANIGAFLAAYAVSADALRNRARADVLEEMANFDRAHARGGLAGVVSRITVHAQRVTPGREIFFLSEGADGGPVGNVVIRQTFIGWRSLVKSDLTAARERDLSERYIAYGKLVGGRPLIVARSTAALEDLSGIFARSFLIGLAASTVVAGLAMLFFVWRAEARIGAIRATLDSVAAGDLARRVPGSARRSDDLGRIALSINEMLDRLADNISGLKQISADIAHDLKTPVQRLRATLEMLRRPRAGRASDADIEGEIVEDAIGQTETIVNTFQALLRIAQIEGGSPRARFQTVDMNELATALADAFQPAAEEAGHVFRPEIEPGAPALALGDRDLLGQMLSNLIENAIRHAPAPARIDFRLAVDGEDVAITVADDGPGVPEAERGRVFRRLYRLERSRTSDGSGLGLAMVAAVAELHDGEVRLEDNDPGLRAVVRLPRLLG